jgi:hypothetical protein
MFTPQKLKLWAEDVYPEIEESYDLGAKAGLKDVEGALEDLSLEIQVPRWDVEAPGARDSIQRAAMDLSASSNSVTQRQLDGLLPRLRAALIDGTAQGEGYDWMTQKVKELFGHADKYRSQRIAVTETQRAIHEGLMNQYQESGVVEATQWLLSGAPCELCIAIAAENEQGVALFAEYAKVGKSETYSSVQSPPAHPNCMCSLMPVLIPVENIQQRRAA